MASMASELLLLLLNAASECKKLGSQCFFFPADFFEISQKEYQTELKHRSPLSLLPSSHAFVPYSFLPS